MKQSTTFIICILFSISCISQNPVYKRFTVDDGLPSNEIYQITQDSKGYIWLATSKGASRFDGSRFENFTIESGLPDNDVLMVIEDKRNRIWFKSFTGPLSYYDGIVHNSSNTPFLKQLEFRYYARAITPLYNGDVLIYASGKEVFLLRDSIVSIYDTISSCSNIIEKRDSSVLLVGYNYIVEDGKRMDVKFYDDFKGLVNSYYNKEQDMLLLVNDSSMFSWHAHELSYVKNEELIDKRSGCVVVADREGYFWITLFNRLYRFKVASGTGLTDIHKYLDGIVVNNIFQDRDNNFWFATKGEGLLMVPALNVRLFNKASGLEDNNIAAAQRVGSKIICGTMNGYLHAITDEHVIEKPVNLNSKDIKKILKDDSNGFFVLTQDELFHQSTNGIKLLCTYRAAYKSIAKGSGGEIIAGGFNVIMKYAHGKMDVSRVGNGYFRVYSICENELGELWLGTEKGLFIYKNDSLIPFHPELKPFKGWIDDICKTKEGKMLITTRDSGLAIVSDGEIDFINTGDGLQSNTCTNLFYDSLSCKIYLGLNKGLSVIHLVQNKRPDIKNYYATSGFLCGSIFSVSENNGEILLGTDKGLLIFNEKDFSSNIESPKVYITNLEINNAVVELKPDYDLSHQANNIRIVYEGISFRNPKSLEYRYRLSPDDKDWNITKSRTVVYPALPPGCYKFLVQVRSGNGQWMTESSSFSFTINKPYWATWWFRTLGAFIFMAIVYGIYRFQLKRKLEQHLAIAADRARISSEMHDDLGSGLSKISMLSDMISCNTSSEDMKPHLENISRSSKEMVEKMGDIIWSMNVKNDQLANLIAYTRKYAMEFFETTAIRCVVIMPEAIPDVNIEGSARRNIFLVVKEALHNVLKHSAADTVTIKFDTTPHSFNITIIDNGKGIDGTKLSANGNGLINMQKRMKDTGGSFSIRNASGTVLEISVPIRM